MKFNRNKGAKVPNREVVKQALEQIDVTFKYTLNKIRKDHFF
jgi:hypothetical protein